jgi:hypothetical protein
VISARVNMPDKAGWTAWIIQARAVRTASETSKTRPSASIMVGLRRRDAAHHRDL